MGKGNRWAELFGLCFSLSTATSSCSRSLFGIRKGRRKPLFFCSLRRNFTYGKRPWLGKSPTTHTYTPRVFAYYLLSIFLFGICVFLICYLGFSYLEFLRLMWELSYFKCKDSYEIRLKRKCRLFHQQFRIKNY
jgi:hypothetical protein